MTIMALPFLFGCDVGGDKLLYVIPEPVSVELKGLSCAIDQEARIVVEGAEGEMQPVIEELQRFFRNTLGDTLSCASAEGKVKLKLDTALAPSFYRIHAGRTGLEIRAGDPAGAFYAVQTLRQVAEVKRGGIVLPGMELYDGPDLGYRGVMLDAARHFFPVEDVKRLLDIMALHKMNVLHWHLTDDQGWRIEIDAFPNLVSVGSTRARTIIGKDPGGEYDETVRYDETPHSGYYTKQQVRDIVRYAADRFITVIPEIEFPGHAVAALASYPYLGCTGEQFVVRETWDIDDRVFCIGRETTFDFMAKVLAEVAELFPSEYVHIGGDECPDKAWKKCPYCKNRMSDEGIGTYRGLQGYAVKRLEAILSSYGKKIVGWDEILDAGISSSAVVMSWRGCESGVKAAASGNKVIMSPTDHCYFDYYQFPSDVTQPLAWGGFLPIEKVYAFNPYEGLSVEQRELVLGVQANLWTEYIHDMLQLEYMLLPRLAAMSEVGWSLSRKDIKRFLMACERFKSLYDAFGYKYAKVAHFED